MCSELVAYDSRSPSTGISQSAVAGAIIRCSANRVIRACGRSRAGALQHAGIALRIGVLPQVAVEDHANGAYDGTPFRSDLDPSLLQFEQSHVFICRQSFELGREVAVEI